MLSIEDKKDGAPVLAALPNKVYAPALLKENESAGVVVGFETVVVKSGERSPDENVVTVPTPDPPTSASVPLASGKV